MLCNTLVGIYGIVIDILVVFNHYLSLTEIQIIVPTRMCIAIDLIGQTYETRADAIPLRLMCIAVNS